MIAVALFIAFFNHFSLQLGSLAKYFHGDISFSCVFNQNQHHYDGACSFRVYNRENGDGSLEFVDKLTGEKSLISVANNEIERKDNLVPIKDATMPDINAKGGSPRHCSFCI